MLPVTIALQTSTAHYNGPTDECCALQMPYNKIPPITTALQPETDQDSGLADKCRLLQQPITDDSPRQRLDRCAPPATTALLTNNAGLNYPTEDY